MKESEKIKVVTLRKQGVSYGGISQQLGLNLNTVKSFCKRCKESGFTPITDRVYCKNCGVAIKQTPHRKKKILLRQVPKRMVEQACVELVF